MPKRDDKVCSECGQPIEPFVSASTGYRHKKLQPKWCDSKAPKPKEK